MRNKGFYHVEKGIGIEFNDIFLVDGKRTPFGRFCGGLARVTPTDLGIYAGKAALEASGFSPEEIHQTITANIGQSAGDAYFLPRHIALYCGVPMSTPALMVQRICASGFETIITAAEQITLGKAENVLCVGTENMSLAPTVSFGNRMGYPLGRPVFQDMLWEALDDTAAGVPMGGTAENVARQMQISRQDCDSFALTSFNRAVEAQKSGRLAEEITPVFATTFIRDGLQPRKTGLSPKAGNLTLDEHVRPTDMETLSKLPPAFSKDGVLTAGNSSGIVDGAGAVVVASSSSLKQKNKTPLARIVAAASCGIDPKIMGLGPVPAIRLLLELTGLSADAIGLVEINEAFSAQIIGCERELNLDRNKLNVNGGAIAIGHPLAVSGLRLSLSLAIEMKKRNVRYGIASACIGGGQGTAILLENPNA